MYKVIIIINIISIINLYERILSARVGEDHMEEKEKKNRII
jgi:hypothetical protein